ncbi:MAG: GrpB family protein [Thermoplasmata archaeon]
MNDKLKERIQELVKEEISIVPYDPMWKEMFREESKYLRDLLPEEQVRRIEHFGSTAVPNLSAKPIIDILVEVKSLEEVKRYIVPILKGVGYEYFWRPTIGNRPPYYAWFIKRNPRGERTHHIHMVEKNSELWDRLLFRDYLREFSDEVKRYDELKRKLSEVYPNDRVKYTEGKTEYVVSVTEKAKEHFSKVHIGFFKNNK